MKAFGGNATGLVLTALAAIALPASTSIAMAEQGGKAAANSPMSRIPDARLAQREALSGEHPRVFGGVEAEKGAWPFQVALLTSGMLDDNPESQFDAQFCGGSLISPEWVLTAAHCLVDGEEPIAADVVTVLLGATALTEGARIVASEIHVHPDYSARTLDNDIGLVRLSTSSDTPTIPMTDSDLESGTATVIGWGRMEDGNFPLNLMQTEIELQSNQSCNAGMKEIYKTDLSNLLWDFSSRLRLSGEDVESATAAIGATMGDPLTSNMLCAGTESGVRDACNGDSGGPLFVTGEDGPMQVGIVSWGDGPLDSEVACGHQNAYGVYTRLSKYRSWINGHTGL